MEFSKEYIDEKLKICDELIRPVVKILLQFGFQTVESCQSGEGHAYPEPIVYFEGDEIDLLRAYQICKANNLAVFEPRRVYQVLEILKDNDYRNFEDPLPGYMFTKPYNALTFVLNKETNSFFY